MQPVKRCLARVPLLACTAMPTLITIGIINPVHRQWFMNFQERGAGQMLTFYGNQSVQFWPWTLSVLDPNLKFHKSSPYGFDGHPS